MKIKQNHFYHILKNNNYSMMIIKNHFVHNRSSLFNMNAYKHRNTEALKYLHGYKKSFGLNSYIHFVEKKSRSQGSLYDFSTRKKFA